MMMDERELGQRGEREEGGRERRGIVRWREERERRKIEKKKKRKESLSHNTDNQLYTYQPHFFPLPPHALSIFPPLTFNFYKLSSPFKFLLHNSHFYASK